MTKPAWRMVTIGKGPGPKNVLAERFDGQRVVFPYRLWKHGVRPQVIEIVARRIDRIGVQALFIYKGAHYVGIHNRTYLSAWPIPDDRVALWENALR